jgi:hypothetical protein
MMLLTMMAKNKGEKQLTEILKELQDGRDTVRVPRCSPEKEEFEDLHALEPLIGSTEVEEVGEEINRFESFTNESSLLWPRSVQGVVGEIDFNNETTLTGDSMPGAVVSGSGRGAPAGLDFPFRGFGFRKSRARVCFSVRRSIDATKNVVVNDDIRSNSLTRITSSGFFTSEKLVG